MSTTVGELVGLIEEFAAPHLAESWDNAGLQVGNAQWPVEKVLVALDPLPEVVQAACIRKAGLLITHHPLIFKPLPAVNTADAVGALIEKALRHRVAVYAAHTNLDAAVGGLNDRLSQKMGLESTTVLRPVPQPEARPSRGETGRMPALAGIGRVGRLPSETTLADLAEKIKHVFKVGRLRMVGDAGMKVNRAAVCSGSGGGLLVDFLLSEADVFVSGDLKYHDARLVENAGRGFLDLGHFASERLMIDLVSEKLTTAIRRCGLSVVVEACRLERDPFNVL